MSEEVRARMPVTIAQMRGETVARGAPFRTVCLGERRHSAQQHADVLGRQRHTRGFAREQGAHAVDERPGRGEPEHRASPQPHAAGVWREARVRRFLAASVVGRGRVDLAAPRLGREPREAEKDIEGIERVAFRDRYVPRRRGVEAIFMGITAVLGHPAASQPLQGIGDERRGGGGHTRHRRLAVCNSFLPDMSILYGNLDNFRVHD